MPFGGGAPIGGASGGLGNFLSNPMFSMFGGLLGGLFGNSAISGGMKDIKKMAQFNPFSGHIGGVGTFGLGHGGGFFGLDPNLAMGQGLLGASLPGLFGGGFANNPDLIAALQQGGGLEGASGAANDALSNPFQSFFNQQGFENNFGNIAGLGDLFSQRVAGGPQDFSQGALGQLLSGGLGNLQAAGDTSGLIQQHLDASRALSQPFENNLINNFGNREFSATRGATTGAGSRQFDLQNSILHADNQRILNAQGLGLQSQNQLGQLGLGQLGQAQGFLGQNLGQFNTEAGLAQGFGGLLGQLEGQGFSQLFGANQGNQSAGLQRLQAMLGLFNTQTGAFNDAFGLGLGGIGGLTDIGGLGLQGVLGLLNAEANRIGATGLHAQAIGNLAGAQGGLLGGLF